MGQVNLSLYVSAEDLYNLPEDQQPITSPENGDDQNQLDAYCILRDDHNGRVPKGQRLNDFTSIVEQGDTLNLTIIDILDPRRTNNCTLTDVQDNNQVFQDKHRISHQSVSLPIENTPNSPTEYVIGFALNYSPGLNPRKWKKYWLDPKLGGHGRKI